MIWLQCQQTSYKITTSILWTSLNISQHSLRTCFKFINTFVSTPKINMYTIIRVPMKFIPQWVCCGVDQAPWGVWGWTVSTVDSAASSRSELTSPGLSGSQFQMAETLACCHTGRTLPAVWATMNRRNMLNISYQHDWLSCSSVILHIFWCLCYSRPLNATSQLHLFTRHLTHKTNVGQLLSAAIDILKTFFHWVNGWPV